MVLHARLAESFGELLKSQLLLQFLQEDLDKDARATGGVFLVHVYNSERSPADAVCGEEVAKESSNVAKTIGFVPMDCVVIVAETRLKILRPVARQFAEALAHVAVEFAVSAFLRATLDNHVAQFDVLSFRNLQLEQLVHTLFKVQGRHDGEVDGASEIDEVRFSSVLNLDLLLGLVFTVAALCVGA